MSGLVLHEPGGEAIPSVPGADPPLDLDTERRNMRSAIPAAHVLRERNRWFPSANPEQAHARET